MKGGRFAEKSEVPALRFLREVIPGCNTFGYTEGLDLFVGLPNFPYDSVFESDSYQNLGDSGVLGLEVKCAWRKQNDSEGNGKNRTPVFEGKVAQYENYPGKYPWFQELLWVFMAYDTNCLIKDIPEFAKGVGDYIEKYEAWIVPWNWVENLETFTRGASRKALAFVPEYEIYYRDTTVKSFRTKAGDLPPENLEFSDFEFRENVLHVVRGSNLERILVNRLFMEEKNSVVLEEDYPVLQPKEGVRERYHNGHNQGESFGRALDVSWDDYEEYFSRPVFLEGWLNDGKNGVHTPIEHFKDEISKERRMQERYEGEQSSFNFGYSL